jgi:hypothetical protein
MARPEPFDESLHALAESLVAIHARLLSFDDACGWVDASKHEGVLKSPVGVAAATRLGEVRAEVERRLRAVEAALSNDVLRDVEIDLIHSLQLDEGFESAAAELIDVLAREAANGEARRAAEENGRRLAEKKARMEAKGTALRLEYESARREAEVEARRMGEDSARREANETARRRAADNARWNVENVAIVLSLGFFAVLGCAVAWATCGASSNNSAKTNSANTDSTATHRALELQPEPLLRAPPLPPFPRPPPDPPAANSSGATTLRIGATPRAQAMPSPRRACGGEPVCTCTQAPKCFACLQTFRGDQKQAADYCLGQSSGE